MKTNTLQIRTPEGVVFSQLLASPVIRFWAWIVDLMVVIAIMTVLNIGAGLLRILSEDIAMAFSTLAYFVISIGYGLGNEWLWRGQTVGKKLFRLRVMDAEGLRLQFNQIAIRNLLRAVDILPGVYFVGGMSCWFSRKNQRLGDIAANTIVIRHPLVTEPDLDQLFSDKYNSLRHYPHLEARLRQQASPEEASVALQALLRRDDFDPQDRIELFSILAAHFREKVSFPAEAIEGVPDEQYVRNVVDVLYRSQKIQRSAPAAV